jgi:hypothetical protein
MPGYGVADANGGSGLLPWSWAVERLLKSHNYWLSTMRPKDSIKARNLAANSNCVVSTENAAEAVIVEGTAELLDISEEFGKVYKAKYDWVIDGNEGNRRHAMAVPLKSICNCFT